jgi:hypothetical protein
MIKKIIDYIKQYLTKENKTVKTNFLEEKPLEETFADIRISLNKNFTIGIKVDLQDHSYDPLTTIEYALSFSDFIHRTLSPDAMDMVLSILDQQIKTQNNSSLINKIKTYCFYGKESFREDVFIRPSEVFLQNIKNN